MKRISKLMLALFTATLLLFGCFATGAEEDNSQTSTSETAEVSFSLQSSQIESSILFASEGASEPNIKYLEIVATNEEGKKIFNGEKIELNKFGESYYTRSYELPIGDYSIASYLILDEDTSAVYGIPKAGTSYVVDNPLPYNFSVGKGESNLVNPQVVAIDSSADPEDFGLTAFTFTVVEDFAFYVNARVYNEDIFMEEYTSATVKVENSDTTYSISGDNNKIIVNPEDKDRLLVTISKDGYESVSKTYTIAELKAFNGENPLSVTLEQTDNNIPTDGLVAYYPFNGNANDESGNGNDGIVHGASLAIDRFGNENSAYSFDGDDDFIVVQDVAELRLNGTDFTLSCWIYLESHNGSYNSAILSKRKTGNNSGWMWTICGKVTGDYMGKTSFAVSGGGDPMGFSDNCVSLGNWYYLTTKYEKTSQKVSFYLNGVLDTMASCISTPNGNISENLFIGKDTSTSTNGYHFEGFIDDIRIYDRALPQDEITALYEEGK